MRRAILVLILCAALVVSLRVGSGQAAGPLEVTISRMRMIGPGRVGFVVAIAGLNPELAPVIQGTATVGGQSIQGPPAPVVAARIPAAIDLPAGRVRVGGDASVVEFPPVPPLQENTPISLSMTVRQGSEASTARQTSVLLLPTVIVPGYLNDLGAKPAAGILSALEERGFHATAASPDVFWFSYRSRALGLKGGAQALAAYVREVVLPKTYAARINVVGYSLGGLLARWNLAFEPGWDHLVNRFVMVGVPNQGSVTSYVYAHYAIAGLARTLAAHDLVPIFPFWRPDPGSSWGLPPDAQNSSLAELNTHPLPPGVRAYAFYGNEGQLDVHDRGTWAGFTGKLEDMQRAVFSYGPGDGVVLAASALGSPINGGSGITLADQLIISTDLGPVGHSSLLTAAGTKIAEALTDRVASDRPGVPMEQTTGGPAHVGPRNGVGFSADGAGFLNWVGRPDR